MYIITSAKRVVFLPLYLSVSRIKLSLNFLNEMPEKLGPLHPPFEVT